MAPRRLRAFLDDIREAIARLRRLAAAPVRRRGRRIECVAG